MKRILLDSGNYVTYTDLIQIGHEIIDNQP